MWWQVWWTGWWLGRPKLKRLLFPPLRTTLLITCLRNIKIKNKGNRCICYILVLCPCIICIWLVYLLPPGYMGLASAPFSIKNLTASALSLLEPRHKSHRLVTQQVWKHQHLKNCWFIFCGNMIDLYFFYSCVMYCHSICNYDKISAAIQWCDQLRAGYGFHAQLPPCTNTYISTNDPYTNTYTHKRKWSIHKSRQA